MLQEIAGIGNGIYVRATNSDTGLNNVLNAVDRLEKKQFESKMYSDYEDRFQWFIAAAFVLLMIETFLSERKSKVYNHTQWNCLVFVNGSQPWGYTLWLRVVLVV